MILDSLKTEVTNGAELLCRCAPEVVAAILFVQRRRKVDCAQSEALLKEFGIEESVINQQRELLNELVEFESVKRDWDSAWLSCILSYIVLLFVLPTAIEAIGLMFWIIAFVVMRQIVRDDRPGGRYRSRRFIIAAFICVVCLSVLAKTSAVLFKNAQTHTAAPLVSRGNSVHR